VAFIFDILALITPHTPEGLSGIPLWVILFTALGFAVMIILYLFLGFLASCIYVIYRVIFHRESIRDAISILREEAFLDNPGMPSGGISDYGYDDRDKYS